MFRIVDVTGATITLFSTGIASFLVTTSTGRGFVLGLSSSQNSPCATTILPSQAHRRSP
jgi:hypothetical protein